MTPLKLTTEWAPCDLCGSNDWETLFTGRDKRHKLPGEFSVVQCRNCGHLQTNPRPTRNSVHTYYPDAYTAHSLTCERVSRSLRDLKLMELARKFGLLGKLILPVATYRFRRLVPSWLGKECGLLLEIGCGVGWFCGLAISMGWRPVGLDISPDACRKAKAMWGIVGVCSDSLPLPFKSQTFNLVVLRHTLEHLFSPRETLVEVHRVLKDGGWVALEVPNANSLGRKIFGESWDTWELPRHLHHFTPRTLRMALEQSGFQNIKVVSARHKPFLLLSRLFPKRDMFAKFGKLVLGLLTWLFLPLVMVRQEGEVLRAWAQKKSDEAS